MKIGVTERGDPGFDLSWVTKLFAANIIITKQLCLRNTAFIGAVLRNKDKIILHIGCTGLGSTVIEPNVPTPTEVREAVSHLIAGGFPVSQMVLRIDPIIPTERGLQRVRDVLEMFSDSGITRCRVSILDLYPHVKARFTNAGVTLPFPNFTAMNEQFRAVEQLLGEFQSVYSFEACAEPNLKIGEKIGCISDRDLDALTTVYTVHDFAQKGLQRGECLCPSGKTELLSHGRKKCPSGCLYCYWKG